jgi:hypothetical protein
MLAGGDLAQLRCRGGWVLDNPSRATIFALFHSPPFALFVCYLRHRGCDDLHWPAALFHGAGVLRRAAIRHITSDPAHVYSRYLAETACGPADRLALSIGQGMVP